MFWRRRRLLFVGRRPCRGTGSRGGGWGVFGRGHLVGSISPGVLVKVDGVGVTFGQARQLRGFAPASP